MLVSKNILGVPKHMKHFESLIKFDSTKICCLLFLLIKVLYNSFVIMQGLAFKKGVLIVWFTQFYFHGKLFDSIYLLILIAALC